jgi:site-specific recombinase XerD
VTLGCEAIPERIAYAREPRKLPAVLSADEVVRFLEAVSSLKARVALTTAYAAGLRVSEVVGLKAADIDSDRMVIRVECGKGRKERYVAHAVRAAARHPAQLLASCASRTVFVPGSRQAQADRADRSARRLPFGARCGRH